MALNSSVVKNVSISDDGVEVVFQSGRVYQYPTANKQTVIDVLSEDSIGVGFNMYMRNLPCNEV